MRDPTYNGWASILNTKGQVDAIMLDFSKAFDKVSHTKLIHKLQYCGISGKILLWLSAFLINWSQFVSVECSHSSYTKVFSGVPQGTVLGPILFLIYINVIANSCDSTIRLLADDTVIYRNISSSSYHDLLQHDLDNLETWAAILQMSFNATKCKLLSITNKKKQSEFAYSF